MPWFLAILAGFTAQCVVLLFLAVFGVPHLLGHSALGNATPPQMAGAPVVILTGFLSGSVAGYVARYRGSLAGLLNAAAPLLLVAVFFGLTMLIWLFNPSGVPGNTAFYMQDMERALVFMASLAFHGFHLDWAGIGYHLALFAGASVLGGNFGVYLARR